MRKPFCLATSLQLDLVIILLESPYLPPSRRDVLRRRKAALERHVATRGARR